MGREWDHLGGDPRPVLDDLGGIERSGGLVEQSHGGEDTDDQVVV